MQDSQQSQSDVDNFTVHASNSSRPRVLDTIEVNVSVDGSERWEQHVVYYVDETTFNAASTVDLTDQPFAINDLRDNDDVRRASQPAADKGVAVFALADLVYKMKYSYPTKESALEIAGYKIVNHNDGYRRFGIYLEGGGSDPIARSLKKLGEYLFRDNPTLKAAALRIAKERTAPSPSAAASPAPAPAPAPMVLTDADVEGMKREAAEAEAAEEELYEEAFKHERAFKKDIVEATGDQYDQMIATEHQRQTEFKAARTSAKAVATGKRKRADAADELLKAQKETRAKKEEEDKVQALLQARKSEREEAEAKEQRLRADFQAVA